MEQNTVTINQLIAQILDEMRRTDYSESTIWRYYQPAMGQFRKYYGQTGQAVYSPEITDEYISLNKERYERGEVTYQSFKKTRYVGRRMNFILLEIENSCQKKGLFRKGTGLLNIQTIAEKYHGAMNIKAQNNSFLLSVLLIIPPHSESISQQIG